VELRRVIAGRAREHRLDVDTPRVTRAFALTYAAMHDVGVACWDAKYA
jgi:hypothetical protein